MTVTCGEDAMSVSAPSDVERSWTYQVVGPVFVGAAAPGPPADLAPYVIVSFAPFASVTPETVIVCAETDRDPALATTYPGAVPFVSGALQPAGTIIERAPSFVPLAGALKVNVIVLC